MVARGFCADCGTPVTFHDTKSGILEISIGSLEQPDRVPPKISIGIESGLPWINNLAGLLNKTTEATFGTEEAASCKEGPPPLTAKSWSGIGRPNAHPAA